MLSKLTLPISDMLNALASPSRAIYAHSCVKAGFHMIADRKNRNKVCDRLRSCDRDRRRSQKIEPCSISCDRLRSIAIVCDLRSYGNQPLDRTWFYLLRSRSQDRRSSFHMIADDRRRYCDLRSAIIWKPAFTK